MSFSSFFQQDDTKKKKKQITRESRAKRDDFLLKNSSNLSQVTAHIHQKYSSELSASYDAIKKAYDEKDIDGISQGMTNLYIYAFDNFVDSDENFQKNNMNEIIKYCLNRSNPDISNENITENLQKVTIAFLINVFRNDKTIIMSDLVKSENGIIQILHDLIQNRNVSCSITVLILQCVTNIASDSKEYRDEVFNTFFFDDNFQIFKFDMYKELLKKYPYSSTFIAMNNLIASYCQYPGDDKSLSSIYEFLLDINILAKERDFYETIALAFVKTMISFINSPEASKIVVEKEYFEIYQLLDAKNEDIVISCLIFFNKLIETINFDLKIDFEIILKLLNKKIVNEKIEEEKTVNGKLVTETKEREKIVNQKVIWHIIRLISNSIVLNPPDFGEKLFNLYFSPFNNESNNTDDNSKKSKNLIFKLYELGSGKVQIESVYLLTNLVRLGSDSLLDTICKESELITIFVDSLNLEDPDLIDAIICALAKIMQSELSKSRQDEIIGKFKEANGYEAIDMLIDDPNESISQQALAFRNKVLESPKPFDFDFENI